jgi:lysophospholipase L1-like esterase
VHRKPLALLLASLTTIAACAATPHADASPALGATAASQYYLALGDSLSAGAQPNSQGALVPTTAGYPHQLATLLREHGRTLSLDDLGCSGETTWTLVHGGVCRYPGEPGTGAQLRAALDFLKAHKGHVPLVTIDIGVNDLRSCYGISSAAKGTACVTPLLAGMSKTLAGVLKALRAADPSATIAGMTYYVPYLASWLTGSAGRAFATVQLSLAEQLNAALTADYEAAGARTGDVFGAFKSGDLSGKTTLPGHGSVPVAVARVCQWTWMCAAPPKGPNVHANKTGYGVIAEALYAVLPASLRSQR